MLPSDPSGSLFPLCESGVEGGFGVGLVAAQTLFARAVCPCSRKPFRSLDSYAVSRRKAQSVADCRTVPRNASANRALPIAAESQPPTIKSRIAPIRKVNGIHELTVRSHL